MDKNMEKPNEVENNEAFLAKFRAEVAEMVHQEDMRRQGYKDDGTAHLYDVEKDGGVKFVISENLTLVDAQMWKRIARYKHFAKILLPNNIVIPENERISQEELAVYNEDVIGSGVRSRELFLGKIKNILAGIWGQEELMAGND